MDKEVIIQDVTLAATINGYLKKMYITLNLRKMN